LFFKKPRSPIEILNDLDGEVVNFLRVCQRHPQELARLVYFQPPSRTLFRLYADQSSHLLTDIERAARFLYLQKNAWSGRRVRQTFHYGVTKPPNWNPATMPSRLEKVASRLLTTQLECLPYHDVLNRYDRPTTFFYCDPPYVDVELYQHNLSDAQFEQLATDLSRLKGRFLLSINDCPKARHWFRHFPSRRIDLAYSVRHTAHRFSELLFANYLLPDP
jgi:DNA adenine methylase